MAIDGLSSITRPIDRSGLVCVASTSFTTAASVSVDNCFTSAYDNYRILFSGTGSTTATALRVRFRASGVDDSSANHAIQMAQASGATSSPLRTTATTSIEVGAVESTDGWSAADIMRPALAAATHYIAWSGYTRATPVLQFYVGAHNVATAYDGFTLFPNAGTITGSVQVYGYRKAV